MNRYIVALLSMIICAQAGAEMKYKTNRTKSEYKTIFEKNLELHQIVSKMAFIAEYRYGKNLVITEVFRTQSEQDRYYRGKRQFTSPHQRWLAIDIRSKNFTKQQVKELVAFVNKDVKHNTYIPTAFFHDVGLGPHIHVQFKERQ